jgi:esterase/lipase superfamily enzyme
MKSSKASLETGQKNRKGAKVAQSFAKSLPLRTFAESSRPLRLNVFIHGYFAGFADRVF